MNSKYLHKLILMLGVYIFFEQITTKLFSSIIVIIRTLNIGGNETTVDILALHDHFLNFSGFVYLIIIIFVVYYFVKVSIEVYTKDSVNDKPKK